MSRRKCDLFCLSSRLCPTRMLFLSRPALLHSCTWKNRFLSLFSLQIISASEPECSYPSSVCQPLSVAVAMEWSIRGRALTNRPSSWVSCFSTCTLPLLSDALAPCLERCTAEVANTSSLWGALQRMWILYLEWLGTFLCSHANTSNMDIAFNWIRLLQSGSSVPFRTVDRKKLSLRPLFFSQIIINLPFKSRQI